MLKEELLVTIVIMKKTKIQEWVDKEFNVRNNENNLSVKIIETNFIIYFYYLY